jgi:uncharacterized protein YjgD (DUF1641 family)
MARPRDTYPEAATNGARERASGDGEAALREALAEQGDDLAAAVERTDDLADVLATAVLVVASADEEDVDRITSSTANLVAAADGLTTDGAAALAGDVGEHADDLSASLETVVRLQREGHLDDLVTVATAFSESLSPEELEEFAATLERDGADVVEALDVVLELQREGHLDALVDVAGTLSAVEVDADAARGMSGFLGAVGEAQRESEPLGPLGALRALWSRDARAGLGYLVAILKAQGRRVRER